MSASQRRKGQEAEREFRDVLRRHGYACERDGSVVGGDLRHSVPGVWWEIKRQERLDIPGWCRQAARDAARDGLQPVVAYRRSRERWKVVVDADYFLRLLERRDAYLEWPE